MGFSAQDGQLHKEMDWFIENYDESGLWWDSYMEPVEKEKEAAEGRESKPWGSYAICRITIGFFRGV